MTVRILLERPGHWWIKLFCAGECVRAVWGVTLENVVWQFRVQRRLAARAGALAWSWRTHGWGCFPGDCHAPAGRERCS